MLQTALIPWRRRGNCEGPNATPATMGGLQETLRQMGLDNKHLAQGPQEAPATLEECRPERRAPWEEEKEDQAVRVQVARGRPGVAAQGRQIPTAGRIEALPLLGRRRLGRGSVAHPPRSPSRRHLRKSSRALRPLAMPCPVRYALTRWNRKHIMPNGAPKWDHWEQGLNHFSNKAD